ncbi:MAG: M24 family metallopeptidase [Candidatus Polarisedimenticolia bacterium]
MDRLDLARGLLDDAGLDALLVGHPANVRYLSGFDGSAGALLISGSGALLITDGRYAAQASLQAPAFEPFVTALPPSEAAIGLARPGARLGFESDHVAYGTWERMQRAAHDKGGCLLVPCRGLIEGLRSRKDSHEMALLEKAARIAADALASALSLVRPGVAERDVAEEVERRMKQAGAEGAAFPPIVASGPRAALPHGRASERRIEAGDLVVIDIGARFEGYHSDMTRTVCAGRPHQESEQIHAVVREAQRRAIDMVRPGVSARDVDAAAREVIAAAGFGDRFTHGTGHGVGLEVHEAPRLGPRSEDVLDAGMVITIEPGIYLSDRTGVRIEDMVAVTPSGSRTLTPAAAPWILE